jgi:glucokinase
MTGVIEREGPGSDSTLRGSMETPLFIGVDIGRTIRAALMDSDGEILLHSRKPSELRNVRLFLDQLVDVIVGLKEPESNWGRVAAVGIGWPGLVNWSSKKIAFAPNLADISQTDVYKVLSAAIGLPLVFDNDANIALYGEWKCGAVRGCQDVFYITIGTGVGAAFVLSGQIQRGTLGFAGEFGHFKVDLNGIECPCGGIGCLETVASGPNIVRRVREQMFRDPALSLSKLAVDTEGTITLQRIVQAAMDGDDLARSVLRETGMYLGTAVGNIVNLLNVEIVVIGGPVMTAREIMLRAIREEARKHAFRMSFDSCRFVTGQLGQDAGIIGAAMLARDYLQGATAARPPN